MRVIAPHIEGEKAHVGNGDGSGDDDGEDGTTSNSNANSKRVEEALLAVGSGSQYMRQTRRMRNNAFGVIWATHKVPKAPVWRL